MVMRVPLTLSEKFQSAINRGADHGAPPCPRANAMPALNDPRHEMLEAHRLREAIETNRKDDRYQTSIGNL
jgi:hypothetical protein